LILEFYLWTYFSTSFFIVLLLISLTIGGLFPGIGELFPGMEVHIGELFPDREVHIGELFPDREVHIVELFPCRLLTTNCVFTNVGEA
jgi:hypothetical protein